MSKTDWLNDVIADHNAKVKEERVALDKVIFKGFLPFADVIEEVSDERGLGQGIWVYPIRKTCAAESVCAPGTLHEDTVKAIVAQLRDVAKEIRTDPQAWERHGGEPQDDDSTGNFACQEEEKMGQPGDGKTLGFADTEYGCEPDEYNEGWGSEPCKYGHTFCAKVQGGTCHDEQMTEEEMDAAMEAPCADCGEPSDVCECAIPKDGWLTEDGQFFIGDQPVRVGQTIIDFRGDKEVYQGVAQPSSPGKSGKVYVGEDQEHCGVYYPHCFVAVE
jgi:hypothetical protein